MGFELEKQNKALLSRLNQQDVGELIKPLQREIALLDTFIAGTSHLEDKKPLRELTVGTFLQMQREDNIYDENAILLLDANKRKLGYVPERDNDIFARLMDAGKCLKAEVLDIEDRGEFYVIEVRIYLLDF